MKDAIERIMPYFGETTYSIEPGRGFPRFGACHLLWLAAAVLIFVLMGLAFRKWDAARRRQAMVIVAVLTVLDELGKYIVTGAWGHFRLDYLPLHLCSINIFLIAADVIRPNRCIRELLYTLSLPGALCALLFPTWTELPVTAFMHLHSFTVHILLMLYPLMLIYDGFEPDLKAFVRTLPVDAAVVAGVFLFNKVFGTNFMFLNGSEPGNPLALAEALLGHPGYLVVFFLLLLAVVVLMNTAVAALIRRLRSAGRPGDVPGSVRC